MTSVLTECFPPHAPQNAEEREATIDGHGGNLTCCSEVRASPRAPQGSWSCTRLPGHTGDHVAANMEQLICARWSTDPADVAPYRLDSRLAPSPCPHCGVELNAAECQAAVPVPPLPGDVTICGHCAAILTFDEQGRHRAATHADLAGLPLEFYGQLVAVQSRVARVVARRIVDEMHRATGKGARS